MTAEINLVKTLLRNKYSAKRELLSLDAIRLKSDCIQNTLLAVSEIKNAESFFIYVSHRSEVQTHQLINKLLKRNKRVSVPCVNIKNKTMLPSYINSFEDDLTFGTMGILEPKHERIRTVPIDRIDVVITPGLVFSEKGWRLGYGGGFYDRFLKNFKKKSYALSYEMQIVSDVPHDVRYDVRVDYIVTEKRIVNCT